MKKHAFMMLVASLPALAFCDEAVTDQQYCCPLLPPEPVDSCQLPSGVFYPAAYTLGECSWNISVAGEWIYWVFARDGGMQSLGNRFRLIGDQTNVEELFHRPGYRSGFRVAASVGLPGCDFAALDIVYTWFHHTTTNHFTAGTDEVLGPRFFPPGFFGSSALRSEFKAHLDFIEVTAGRPFYVSQRLIAKPGVGLKGWWTAQDQNLFFTTLSEVPAFQLSKSGAWGIGPCFTLNVDALLWCGFYVAGRAGLWAAYTEFNKHEIVSNFPGALVNVERNSNKPYITQLFYESAGGIGWGSYFCNCAYHVDLKVTYEFINSFILDTLFSNGLPSREAYIQGLSVRGEFAF